MFTGNREEQPHLLLYKITIFIAKKYEKTFIKL